MFNASLIFVKEIEILMHGNLSARQCISNSAHNNGSFFVGQTKQVVFVEQTCVL